jgi:exopolysaccharide biosynthesis WecB/TagA/CpsF family protein
MIDRGKRNILGIGVDAIDYDGAVRRIAQAAQKGAPLTVSALAVHGVMTGVLEAAHRYRLNRFDLICPDGQPVRWALNWLHGAKLDDRVYGPNLMLRTCQKAATDTLPIFLYGGSEELLAKLRSRLLERFPQLPIAGWQASRFRRVTPDERAADIETIRKSGAKITFVGLGCPRQEVWAFEMREALSMPILAVGAAFNFHAGELPQAPAYLQRRGLEWFYRLCKEPRRLWRRYVYLNPLYAGLLALQATGLRRFDTTTTTAPAEQVRFG